MGVSSHLFREASTNTKGEGARRGVQGLVLKINYSGCGRGTRGNSSLFGREKTFLGVGYVEQDKGE